MSDAPFRLTCRARLEGRSVVRPLLIEGAEASGAGVDCGGGALGRPGVETAPTAPSVAIRSRPVPGSRLRWSRPTDVAITDCTVHGGLRIWGMGAGGEIESLRRSSRTPGHTVAAQAAAPSHVVLTRLVFMGTGSIPLYIGPGTTATTVTGARFAGWSNSSAVYLDAESAGNLIANSVFAIRTAREQIAVDGSARNRITGSRFDVAGRGGVFLYRNCGEDGVIRHQTPSDNRISGNVFTGADWLRPRAVVVGSREGRRRYCAADRGWAFGSSADDGDHATGNLVSDNRVERSRPF